MLLSKVLDKINFKLIKGSLSLNIKGINYDSRKVKEGEIFVCIEGYLEDGCNFIDSAIEKGCTCIVSSHLISVNEDVTVILVEDIREALSEMSFNYYEHPEKSLKLIGITGTNGKTTSSFMIKSILEAAGHKVALLGTIAIYIGNTVIKASRTTPESLELAKLFKKMVEEKIEYCVMEVSSQSLYLKRVFGLRFCQAVFTNLTQDHLDFHKTFENYYEAKLILFKNADSLVINGDDSYGRRILNEVPVVKATYGLTKGNDFYAEKIEILPKGSRFLLNFKDKAYGAKINIPGDYNIYNALGSALACLNEGVTMEDIILGLNNLKAVPGRCEIVSTKYNLPFEIIIDYAHSPDGLLNILNTARKFTKGNLIVVFGCGGDRDKSKRPIMGEIATNLSDFAVITSDNPRTEAPGAIINDIINGVSKNNYMVIENRKEGIKKAIELAKEGDVIVIAGKGHEDYQILKDKTIHFDEKEIIDHILKELYK